MEDLLQKEGVVGSIVSIPQEIAPSIGNRQECTSDQARSFAKEALK